LNSSFDGVPLRRDISAFSASIAPAAQCHPMPAIAKPGQGSQHPAGSGMFDATALSCREQCTVSLRRFFAPEMIGLVHADLVDGADVGAQRGACAMSDAALEGSRSDASVSIVSGRISSA
jgi:hypothetical protein